QNIKCDRWNGANGELSGDLVLERCHRLARLGDPRQNLARVNKQSSAGFGKNHRARQSIEQLLVQFLFQLMDLLTERRLRYVLALRRVGEATLLGDSNKVSELMNFHRGSDTPLGPPVCLRLAVLCPLLSALCSLTSDL